MEVVVEAETKMETHGLEGQPVGDEGNSPMREEGRKDVDSKVEVNHGAPYPFYLQSPREGIEKKKNWNTFGKTGVFIHLTHPLSMIF